MSERQPVSLPFDRPETSSRATERRTHPTHWPAAFNGRFSRVRSACTSGGSVRQPGAPGLFKSADCLHGQVGL